MIGVTAYKDLNHDEQIIDKIIPHDQRIKIILIALILGLLMGILGAGGGFLIIVIHFELCVSLLVAHLLLIGIAPLRLAHNTN